MNAMSGNIERRVSKGLILQFLYGNERYYSSMQNRLDNSQNYLELLKNNLPENWR
jgi:hypothetical protein